MGLLISQDSVFVWGPEACLRFLWKGAPSTKEHRICGRENNVEPISHDKNT